MAEVKVRTLENFKKAVTALDKAIALRPLPELANRDAVLLRFELAAELMPKVLKRVLAERGAVPALPKDIVRTALSGEMINERLASVLLEIIDDRNRMVHDYNEDYSEKLFARIEKNYAPAFQELLNNLTD
ncbi:MAG: nucleotidyltransferase substrate binding protein [Candidatus Yanofskybacteria bacterium]|nr:nucleotidyltransferase substrate binding protein [Candidatus Yanofskybacteria bacterium]